MKCLVYPLFEEGNEDRVECFTQIKVGEKGRKIRKTSLGYINYDDWTTVEGEFISEFLKKAVQVYGNQSFILVSGINEAVESSSEAYAFTQGHTNVIRKGKERQNALLILFNDEINDLIANDRTMLIEVVVPSYPHMDNQSTYLRCPASAKETTSIEVLFFKSIENMGESLAEKVDTLLESGNMSEGLIGDIYDQNNTEPQAEVIPEEPEVVYKKENVAIWATLFVEGRPTTVIFGSDMNETVVTSTAVHFMPVSVNCRDINVWMQVYKTAVENVKAIIAHNRMAMYHHMHGHDGSASEQPHDEEITVDVFIIIGSCNIDEIRPNPYTAINKNYALFDSIVSADIANSANLVLKVLDEESLTELVENIETLGKLFMRSSEKQNVPESKFPRRYSEMQLENQEKQEAIFRQYM